jgi:hypothetical protein
MTMRGIPFAAGALVAAAALTGCVRIHETPFGPTAASVPADSVRVFAVDRPAAFTELAILRARRFLVSDRKVLDALRERAARMGANGLLLINAAGSATKVHSGTGVIIGGKSNGGVVVGNAETSVDAFERAVAIRWTR